MPPPRKWAALPNQKGNQARAKLERVIYTSARQALTIALATWNKNTLFIAATNAAHTVAINLNKQLADQNKSLHLNINNANKVLKMAKDMLIEKNQCALRASSPLHAREELQPDTNSNIEQRQSKLEYELAEAKEANIAKDELLRAKDVELLELAKVLKAVEDDRRHLRNACVRAGLLDEDMYKRGFVAQ